jgi:hypothetical protein
MICPVEIARDLSAGICGCFYWQLATDHWQPSFDGEQFVSSRHRTLLQHKQKSSLKQRKLEWATRRPMGLFG